VNGAVVPRLPHSTPDDRALQRRHLHGDIRAREELIGRYLPLARALAQFYEDRAPLTDLIQVTAVGLVAAVERWDPADESPFSSHAVATMADELDAYFRGYGQMSEATSISAT
jgi:RNA polymerase sigma-B factor